jgi:protein disulfide-isomerase
MALHENVLSKPEFTDYAKSNLVFVELDFPRRKPQTEEVKKANEQLSDKFRVEGFPTLILLNADGKELWREVGYASEKPADLINKLDKNKASK